LDVGTHYEWQQCYEAAILETDRSLLPKRITEAQAAIDRRVEELRSRRDSNNGAADGHAAEEQAIADALAGVRILIKEIG
jgi:hypothetical protein